VDIIAIETRFRSSGGDISLADEIAGRDMTVKSAPFKLTILDKER
jgi:hypothetical protein